MKLFVKIYENYTNNYGDIGKFFLRITLKIAKLHYKHYYPICMMEDIDLNYHPTKFGDNCKMQC